MYTIKNNNKNELIIKNSRFISLLYKVYNIEEVTKYLEEIKQEYKDATHYCYAYIIDNYKKFSDDNEPGGTAGNPMLQVLEKNNLNYVLCIIVRYFGGIKLGAGGLVRAYTKSVSNCLDNIDKLELIKGKNINITFTYDKINIIDNILKDAKINNKTFDELITYNVNIENNLIDKLNNIATIDIIKDIYIEK